MHLEATSELDQEVGKYGMGLQFLNQPFSFFQPVKLHSGSWRSGTYRRNTSSSSSSSKISTSCRGTSCSRGMKKLVLTLTFSLVYCNINFFYQVVLGSFLVFAQAGPRQVFWRCYMLCWNLKILLTVVIYRSVNYGIFPFDSLNENTNQPQHQSFTIKNTKFCLSTKTNFDLCLNKSVQK